jgi:hypothetical protein
MSWETGSVPSALVEVESEAETEYQEAQKVVAEGNLLALAEGDALTTKINEQWNIERSAGRYTTAYVTLTDAANAGPITFSQGSVSFSVGRGGLTFDGVNDGTTLVLPRGGTVAVKVRSKEIGASYILAAGTLTFFARGILPGVTCTNLSTWLTDGTAMPQGGTQSGCQQGSSATSDADLRAQAIAQWGTLGTGSPASAYEAWARASDPSITKVSVLTNLDLLRPGRVDILIAGDGGGLGAGVILNAQNAIAPLTFGGSKIPETAEAVVSSASNVTVIVQGTIYVRSTYNTAAFQANIAADLLAHQKEVPIGGLVSWERVLGVVQNRAGTGTGIIRNIDWTSPVVDLQMAYNQTAVFSLSLTYVSV